MNAHGNDRVRQPRTGPRRSAAGLLTALLAGTALLAAACGGGSVGGAGSSPYAKALAYVQCMRSNGVPNFPDPRQFAGGNVKLAIHGTPSTPKVRSALNACGHLLPAGRAQVEQETRQQLADELSFARCMRSHGVGDFPDPKAQGGLTVEMVEAAGIDVHSAAVLRVVQTCLPASHGGLTVAKVEEAIAHAGG